MAPVLRFLPCAFLCLLCGAELGAEQEQPYAVRVEVSLVSLDVAVVDGRGHFVPGLTQRNFRVFEDDQEQSITHFASQEAPLSVALLVETSPAVYLIQHEHLAAVFTLFDYLKPADSMALARYDRQWQPLTELTHNQALIRTQLQTLNYSLGMAELNLLDALAGLLDWLAPTRGSSLTRKAVLLIGTGLDTRSRTPQETVQQKLAASQVTLFAVATGSLLRAPAEGEPQQQKKRRGREKGPPPSEPDVEAAFSTADARLKALTEETGGRAYFPRSAAELGAAYREIGQRLRHSYGLGYVSSNRARDGKFHSVRIELLGADGQPLLYRVIARRGYYAPRE